MKIKKQTFLQGSLILLGANLIVKVVGAFFKIPLSRIIGREGMGLFNTAYNIYASLFVIATAGLPVAVSKMVSESITRGNPREARRIFRIAFFILSLLGLAGSVLFYFGSGWLAEAIGDPLSAGGIRAIAPAVLLVAMVSAFRGFFQGNQNMIPTAISELMEALGKLGAGLLFAAMLISLGIEPAATGAIRGVVIGTFLAFLVMLVIYISNAKHFQEMIERSASKSVNSIRRLAATMVAIAVPITIGASVSSLTNLIDTAMIRTRLQEIGFTMDRARELYGAYSGYAVTMFNMPIAILTALSMSVVPAVAGALAVGRYDEARRNVVSAVRISMLFSIPCAVGLSVLAGPVLHLLFRDSFAANMLSILAYGVIFVSAVSVTTAVLQAAGRVYIPVVNMLIGGVVKIIINYTLVGNPDINITGAPISTNICYGIIAVLNLLAVARVLKVKYDYMGSFIKPGISAAAMGAVVYLAYFHLPRILNSQSITALISILIGMVVYLAVLIALGGLDKSDLLMMPKGEKIIKIMQKLKLM